MSFFDDIFNAFGGGLSDEERKRFAEMIKRAKMAYGEASNDLSNQYFGPTSDIMSGINSEDYQNYSDMLAKVGGDYSKIPLGAVNAARVSTGKSPITVDDIRNTIEAGDKQKATMATSLGYAPTNISAITLPKSAEYTPAQMLTQSELQQVADNPGMFGTPNYQAAIMQNPSLAALANADAEGINYERGALGNLADIVSQGGMTAIDRARYDEQRRAAAQEEKAAREAIMNNMAQRGITNSGINVSAQLAAAQAASDRLNSAGVQIEGLAQARKDQTIRDLLSGGRNLANDIYSQQYQKGAAQDIINQFNTLGARDVQQQKRNAQDAFVNYLRDALNRDTSRANSTNVYNTDVTNAYNQWLANNKNSINASNVGIVNTAMANNAANQSAANQWNAQNAWNALMGYNANLGNQGNLAINEANAINAIKSTMPTTDIGQYIKNFTNFAYDPLAGKEQVSGVANAVGPMMGGGGSGGGGNAMGGAGAAAMFF